MNTLTSLEQAEKILTPWTKEAARPEPNRLDITISGDDVFACTAALKQEILGISLCHYWPRFRSRSWNAGSALSFLPGSSHYHPASPLAPSGRQCSHPVSAIPRLELLRA